MPTQPASYRRSLAVNMFKVKRLFRGRLQLQMGTSRPAESLLFAITAVTTACGGGRYDVEPPTTPSPPQAAVAPAPVEMPSRASAAGEPTATATSVKVLASGLSEPFGIAVDATSVYWTEMKGGRVMKLAKAGGDPVELVKGFVNPTGVALDADNVYYTLQDPQNGNVKSVAKAGPKTGWSFVAQNQVSPTMIYADDAAVVWGYGSGERDDGGVVLFTKADKKTRSVVKNQHRVFAVLADASALYWTDQRTNDVWRSDKNGNGPRLLSKSVACSAMAQDAARLYFACDQEVRAVSKVDGARTTICRLDGRVLRGIASDDKFVYFGAMSPPKGAKRTVDDLGAILKVAKTGGEPQEVSHGNAVTVTNIAVDDASVYWTSDLAGAVMSSAK